MRSNLEMKLITLPRFVTLAKNAIVEAAKRQSSGMPLSRPRIFITY